MKQILHRILSCALALSLMTALAVPAVASEALGDDLINRDTLVNQGTQLSQNTFWSTAYSDLRAENLITYTPNGSVTPIVTYGDTLTACTTVSTAASVLESQGYRVVAGLNGDFYNFSNGLPIGLVISNGEIKSTDGGFHAIGFRSDGTAVLGRPAVKVSADLGYVLTDEAGTPTEVVRSIAAVNKARTADGGIYLYTYDFNSRHTTGTTDPGVEVVCAIEDGALSIGGTLTLRVEEVLADSSAAAVEEGKVVLSAHNDAGAYTTDALRNIPVGSLITVTASAASADWYDVRYAVGSLYSLVEYGAVVSGLEAGVNPRTAVGQRPDGSLVFYTIDGRQKGHSIGASLTQVAQRLVELGCVTALCLDGGGSTTLTVTSPDSTTAKTVNRPSGGSERAVSNHIFLVASSQPTGVLDHYYVSADNPYVLAGSKVNISAAAVDTNFIPMSQGYELSASAGTLEGGVLTTPKEGGEITVTASGQGSVTVHAVTTPDAVAVRNAANTIITGLSALPGSTTQLIGSAAYKHFPLKADPEAFTWTVEGDIGTVDSQGRFTAALAPGQGRLTVSAGGQSASIDVAVTTAGPELLEDFEGESTIFRGIGEDMDYSLNHAADSVRMGRASGKLDYSLQEGQYIAAWRFATPIRIDRQRFSHLTLWVLGDGSGNRLELRYSAGENSWLSQAVATLDFTGWKQVTVPLDSQITEIHALCVSILDEDGSSVLENAPLSGTIYLDHVTASRDGAADNTPPVITAQLNQENWSVTGTVTDGTDGLLPSSAVKIYYNGTEQPEGCYDAATGQFSVFLAGPGESQEANRITVVAKDASGNIGRASVDTPAYNVDRKFTDTADYWGADYADFLYNAGITTGYEDGTFRPNQNITRAQFSVMLCRYLGLDEAKYAEITLPFADLNSIPAYALPAIRALYAEGVVNGSAGKNGKIYFNPGSPLTRAQAAAMIGRTQEKGYAVAELSFSDAASIPAYASFYIRTMTAQGILSGYEDGTFRPGQNITRGQMAKILYNLL